MNKIETGNGQAKAQVFEIGDRKNFTTSLEQGLVDVKTLAYFTSMSERMIFNLMKEPEFPKLKIGRRLLFDKKVVMEYLVKKYGNW